MSAPSFASMRGDYATLWQNMVIPSSRLGAITATARRILSYKGRYKIVEKATGVPWFFIGIIHYREADLNFHCHLHNGDPLIARTVHVPAGRPLKGEPPFRWEDSAVDALQMEGLRGGSIVSVETFAYCAEGYNGWGYEHEPGPDHGHATSAYLWGDTNEHSLGKFTSDHHYDPNAPEIQIGVMPLLKVLMQLDPTIRFGASTVAPTPAPAPAPAKPAAKPVEAKRPSWIWRAFKWVLYKLFAPLAKT